MGFLLYIIIGILFGEIIIHSFKENQEEINKVEVNWPLSYIYCIGIFLWPFVLMVWMCGGEDA